MSKGRSGVSRGGCRDEQAMEMQQQAALLL